MAIVAIGTYSLLCCLSYTASAAIVLSLALCLHHHLFYYLYYTASAPTVQIVSEFDLKMVV